jgi:putative transposase
LNFGQFLERPCDSANLEHVESGTALKDLCRTHGFSDASFYKWRVKFGGMNVSETRRLKVLEGENGKLKKLLAEAHLDIHALKSVFRCF